MEILARICPKCEGKTPAYFAVCCECGEGFDLTAESFRVALVPLYGPEKPTNRKPFDPTNKYTKNGKPVEILP